MAEFIFWAVMSLGAARFAHLVLKSLDWIEGGKR